MSFLGKVRARFAGNILFMEPDGCASMAWDVPFRIGAGGTPIRFRKVGTLSVNPADQVGAGFFDHVATIEGILVGDVIQLHAPATLENTLRLVGYTITDTDELTIRLQSTAAVNGAALTWQYTIERI